MAWWETPFRLDPDDPLPAHAQLSRAVVGDIRRGRLKPGDALPGSRTLSKSLGVHRNTVLASYTALIAEGWLTTRPAGATFVSRELPPRPIEAPSVPAASAPGFPISAATFRPYGAPPYPKGTLLLAKGTPDLRLLPTAVLARAYRHALGRHAASVLDYTLDGQPKGHERLRTALGEMLTATRGLAATPERLLVTRGSQMAVDLIARSLLAPGDAVAVEALGHPPVWDAFRLAGARLFPLPVDQDGLSIDALEALAHGQPLRAVYLTPHHQFPTTVVMPSARRQRLLAFARAHNVAVIEDDYDHEFHYEGRPVLPMESSDPHGLCIYVGTLSKVLAPGLRVGFIVAPAAFIARLADVRVCMDLQGELVTELALAQLFEDGELSRHVRRMRRIYRARRDVLVSELESQLPNVVRVRTPSGGMALWAEVAEDVDLETWSQAGLAHGVWFRSARSHDFAGDAQPFMRLGFSWLNDVELREAVQRMKRALPRWRSGRRGL